MIDVFIFIRKKSKDYQAKKPSQVKGGCQTTIPASIPKCNRSQTFLRFKKVSTRSVCRFAKARLIDTLATIDLGIASRQ